MVINYDVPLDAESYVHRIGRTARAGREGKTVTMACEEYVYGLGPIEKLLGRKIPVSWADEELIAEDKSEGMRFPPQQRYRELDSAGRGGDRNRSSGTDALETVTAEMVEAAGTTGSGTVVTVATGTTVMRVRVGITVTGSREATSAKEPGVNRHRTASGRWTRERRKSSRQSPILSVAAWTTSTKPPIHPGKGGSRRNVGKNLNRNEPVKAEIGRAAESRVISLPETGNPRPRKAGIGIRLRNGSVPAAVSTNAWNITAGNTVKISSSRIRAKRADPRLREKNRIKKTRRQGRFRRREGETRTECRVPRPGIGVERRLVPQSGRRSGWTWPEGQERKHPQRRTACKPAAGQKNRRIGPEGSGEKT